MNGQTVKRDGTRFRIVLGMGWLCLCIGCPALKAARQPIVVPEPASSPTTLKTEARQWAEKMLQARREHHRLLAEKHAAAGDGQIEKLDRRMERVWASLADDYPIECDWFVGDLKSPIETWSLTGDPARVETDMLTAVMTELGDSADLIRTKLQSLPPIESANSSAERLSLYADACRLRRIRRLQRLEQKYPRIVFVKHYDLGGSHYAYTEGQSDAQQEAHFVEGAALCIMELNGPWAAARPLLEDPAGVIRDPDVSYDGRKILFSWKKSRFEDDYHLYEYNLPPQQFSQLTEGLGVSDYEGVYLPAGDIVFNSTRCVQTVDCFWTEVSNLYTCSADGDYLRRLSFDQVHTNYPQVLQDGRIIYTRWDYNDRGQIYPQPLFQMNPDGTGQTEYYGNNSWFPTAILHARGIPASPKLIAVLSGHHTTQKGKLALIDVTQGRQENEGVQLIAPTRHTEAVRIDAYGQEGDQFQYPYAITENEYIVGFQPEQIPRRRFGLYWMDSDGRRELLVYDRAVSCSQPVPLAERPLGHIRPNLVDYTKDYGTVYMQNVYEGPGLKGIPKGAAKKLRVVALEFRAAGIGMNGSHGPGGGALSSTPPAIDNAGWDVKKVLGTATIYEDGSALFTVPDRTPVYFQVLDENNQAIQSMRSWSTLQPGEYFSCIGCHEHKNQAPPPAAHTTQAMQAGPQQLDPFYGPARGFSFPREIQPILDRHCIQCHDQRPDAQVREESGKAFSLLGTENVDEKAKRKWSDAYRVLTDYGRPNEIVNWLGVQSVPTLLEPYTAGAARSRLMTLLQKGHQGVKLSREEMDKIACWIDLLVPYCGDYTEANAWNEQEAGMYEHFMEKRRTLQAQEKENIRRYQQQR